MPELSFQVCGAEAVRGAVEPAIALRIEISNSPASQAIQTVLLNCQIRIETARRPYSDEEQRGLRDLFGEPERWGQTLRPMHWTNLTTTVPGFEGRIGMKLSVPCTFDFNVAATKFFHALGEETVPLTLLFSGTIFYRAPEDRLQAAPIPWNSEARFSFPAHLWKECIDLHYPNTAWLGLRRDNFDRLHDFKVRHGLATFDEAVERMLGKALEAGA